MELKDLKSSLDRIEAKASEGVEKSEALEQRVGEVEQTTKRLEKMEVRMLRPNGEPGGGGFWSADQKNHVEIFEQWLRAPESKSIQNKLLEVEQRVASGASDAAGGYLIPEILASSLASRIRDVSPLRQICRVISVSSSNFKMPLSNNDAAAGWVGENATRSATAEPTLEQASPTFGMSYAYVSASEEIVMDSAFSISSWLVDSISDALSEQEGTAFVSGNGTNKPTGFLNATPSTPGDDDSPARTYPALQYIPTGAAGAFPNDRLGSPPADPVDCLIDTIYALKASYRARGTWVMNSATAGVIRKFKDADGRYIWSDSVIAGEPSRLLGYPVLACEQMPDIGSNTFPVAFGDFMRGYAICEQGQLRITYDDNITTPGAVKWYVRRRVGGITLDNNAIKVVKAAAS